jgi:hypothetical protein
MTDSAIADQLRALADDYQRRAEKASQIDAAKTLARAAANAEGEAVLKDCATLSIKFVQPLSKQILRARPRCLQRQTGEHHDFIQNSRRFAVVVGDGEHVRVLNNIEETSRSKLRFVRSQTSGSWQLFLVPPRLFCGGDRLFLYRSNPMYRNSSRRAWPM